MKSLFDENQEFLDRAEAAKNLALSIREALEAEEEAQRLGQAIEAGYGAYIQATEGRGSQDNPPYLYASRYHPCTRALALYLTHSNQLPQWDLTALARFRRGKDRERDLLADLTYAGRYSRPAFDVVAGQERFELRDKKGRVAIVGKVDARLKFESGLMAPIEVKAWSPFLVDRVKTFSDLFNNPWTRRGALQLLCYLLGAGENLGFMLLDRSGLPSLLPAILTEHLDEAEAFLSAAEKALDSREAGEPMPEYSTDPAECKRCDFFGSICNPPLNYGAGAAVITDPEIEADLQRHDELKKGALEWLDLDKKLKERLRGTEAAICGEFFISGKFSNFSKLDLPPEIRKKYTQVVENGQFRLKIEKVG